MEKCLILSGGEFEPVPIPEPGVFVIACDRGYAYARRCGIRPDLVVSDFDSYSGAVEAGVPVTRLKTEKDDTDTLSAIRAALDRGCREIELRCALGGRLDHTLANLQAAVFAQTQGARVHIVGRDTEILTLSGGTLRLPRREGFSLSVFTLGEPCRGVGIRGAKYPLENAEISAAFPIGVSNEWREDTAEITVESGVLLLVLSKLS